MQRHFKLNKRTVHFKMLGTATGGFSGRFTSQELADKNHAKLCRSFNSASATLMLPQCHSNIVHVMPGVEEAVGDTLITEVPYHALILRPADCIPLLLFTNITSVVALVHGSRQGLEESIIEKTIDELKALGIAALDIQAYIGPSIQKESYRLPIQVANKLVHPTWEKTISRQKDSALLNITGFANLELQRLGVKHTSIAISSIDTAENRSYYSHYRSTNLAEPDGRNGVVVVTNN